MWKKLAESSLGGLLSHVSVGYVALIVGLASAIGGGYANGVRWEAKYTKLQHTYESQLLDAQAKAAEKTTGNAVTTAAIDTKYYKEYQDAKQTTDDLRAQLRAGTLRMRTPACANSNATVSTSTSVAMDKSPTLEDVDKILARTFSTSQP